MRSLLCALLLIGITAGQGSCQLPRNIYGAHLLVDNTGETGTANLKWARFLVGKYGFAKTLMGGIDKTIDGPKPGWIDWVNACYKMDLVPVCRLAGHYRDGWIKPEADADGSYKSMAEAVKKVVAGLPKSDTIPLYIEVWNEPNLDLEWSGKANLDEYARFFVEVSRAIRSLGDSRVRVMNGAFALSPQATEACCKAQPEFANSFDVWASHPYPQNHPPEYNIHDGTAKIKEHTIDAYLLETAVLEKYGRKNAQVMITETGHALGIDLFTDTEGYPPIDEFNRADYMMRAYRDYWVKWPEIVAVLPFEFSDAGWMGFNWVDPGSNTRADGSPTKPHYQYTLVSKLAKPLDTTGSISGKITDAKFGVALQDASISLKEAPFAVKSDATGDYIRPALQPAAYHIRVTKAGFDAADAEASVAAGGNAVANVKLRALEPGSLSGRVTDPTTGQAVSGARITLSPGGGSAVTDSRGNYKIAELPPLTFSAEAALAGYNSHAVQRIAVEPKSEIARDFKIAASLWPSAKNDCSNPSFELLNDPTGTNAIAARWEVQGSPGGHYEVVQGISHSGDRCQAIHAAPGTDWMLRMISRYGYSQPGATYTAGVWIKTDGIFKEENGGAYLSLDFQNNNGETLSAVVSEEKLGGTVDWTCLKVSGVAPPSQRISVVLHVRAREGIAYFDDAYLAMTSPPGPSK